MFNFCLHNYWHFSVMVFIAFLEYFTEDCFLTFLIFSYYCWMCGMSRSSFALKSPVKYKTARLSSKLSSLS